MAYIPSVSKVLNATQSEQKRASLERWRQRVGEQTAEKICSDSKTRGETIHSLIEYKLKDIEPRIHLDKKYWDELGIDNYWSTMEPIVDNIQYPFAIELPIVHGDLNYQGRFDMLAYWEGKLTMIDFKTKSKPLLESYLEDDFTQIAAYTGAVEYNRPELKIEQGLIIAVNPEGSQLFLLDRERLNDYWNLWLVRLTDFDKDLNIEKYLIIY